MKQSLMQFGSIVPISDINAYCRHVNDIPMLTLEQEQQYARTLFFDNDLSAAKKLILPHLRYVARVAKNYAGYGLPIADLIQEGNIGLMKAVKKFNPDIGVRLVSFAVHWIKAEIHEFILKNWRIVKVATTKAQRKLFFNLRKFKKRLGWFSEHEIQQVANDLNVPVKSVREMEQRLNATDSPYDPLPRGEEQISCYEQHPSLHDETLDPEKLIEHSSANTLQTQALEAALKTLNPRAQHIIQSRWLSQKKKKTLQTLARELNVSAERIRQLEKAAFASMKEKLNTTTVFA